MRSASMMLVLGAAVFLGCFHEKEDPDPPAVDVTGTWSVTYEYNGTPYNATAILYMADDGSVTGTYDGYDVTGRVSGYSASFRVDTSDPIYIDTTIDPTGTSADGSWHDSADSGQWVATRLWFGN